MQNWSPRGRRWPGERAVQRTQRVPGPRWKWLRLCPLYPPCRVGSSSELYVGERHCSATTSIVPSGRLRSAIVAGSPFVFRHLQRPGILDERAIVDRGVAARAGRADDAEAREPIGVGAPLHAIAIRTAAGPRSRGHAEHQVSLPERFSRSAPSRTAVTMRVAESPVSLSHAAVESDKAISRTRTEWRRTPEGLHCFGVEHRSLVTRPQAGRRELHAGDCRDRGSRG